MRLYTRPAGRRRVRPVRPMPPPLTDVPPRADREFLTFEQVSPRAWRAIERAGGEVYEQRTTSRYGAPRPRYLVAMPPAATWFRGRLWDTDRTDRMPRVSPCRCTPGGRPCPCDSIVHRWHRPRGKVVLVRDPEDRLWHWRDPRCPVDFPF